MITTPAQAATIDVNTTFPAEVVTPINRDHLIDGIEDLFTEGYDAVFVDGPDGIGKTTLLASFARRHRFSIALFLRSASRWCHDTDLLHMELCNQMHWLVHGTQISSIRQVDGTLFRDCLMGLQRLARRQGTCYHFVVDGLDELQTAAPVVIPAILDLIPFGHENFRFLLSGDPTKILAKRRHTLRTKEFRVPPFGTAEIEAYFAADKLDSADVRAIRDISRGVPGRLAAIKRLRARGESVNSIINDPRRRVDLFEIECRFLDTLSDNDRLAVAVLAHDRVSRSLDELAQITERPLEELTHTIASLSFLELHPSSHEVLFASDSLRTFVAERLKSLRGSVSRRLIAYSLRDPDSVSAAKLAPLYLHDAGEYDQLLEYLTDDRFQQMLDGSQSVTFARERCDLALTTASRLKRPAEAVRLALQDAVLRDFDATDVWVDELNALLAIEQFESAITLARRLFLKEDRLHAGAIVVRSLHKRQKAIPADLAQEIATLIAETDVRSLGRRGAEIAGELIHGLPRLAIELAEKSHWEADGRSDSRLARFSMAAHEHELDEETTQSLAGLSRRIQDPVLRLLAQNADDVVGDYSAEQLIAQTNALEKPADKLFLLKAWTGAHRDAVDASAVIQAALDLLVSTTDYQPTLVDLRKIATPLPLIPAASAAIFIDRISRLATSLEPMGPSEEYIRLQMLLARGEAQIQPSTAHHRAIESYYYVAAIPDLTTRANSLAWLLRALPDIDVTGGIERTDGLAGIITAELNEAIEQLLQQSAEHLEIVRPIVRALAKNHLSHAIDITQRLNTEARRDAALYATLDAALHSAGSAPTILRIVDATTRFASPPGRHLLITHVLEEVSSNVDILDDAAMDALAQEAQSIAPLSLRCGAYAHLQAIVARRRSSAETVQPFVRLQEAWAKIEDPWEKIEAGFETVTFLSDSPNEAKALLSSVRFEQRNWQLDTAARGTSYFNSVRLAIRAFAGLSYVRAQHESELDRILALIERVPSPICQAGLLDDLCCRLFAARRDDLAKQIVSDRLEAVLASARAATDHHIRSAVLSECASSYNYASPHLFLKELDGIPLHVRDPIIYAAITFMLYRIPPSDPYDSEQARSTATREDLVSTLQLITRCYSDNALCGAIKHIVRVAKQLLTREQAADLSRSLDEIIDRSLPNSRFIAHVGYASVCRAHVLTMRHNMKLPDWQPVLDSIPTIPNVADRMYVRSAVAPLLPSKLEEQRDRLVAEAIAEADLIPAAVDRYDRLTSLADAISPFAAKKAKEILKLSAQALLGQRSKAFAEITRRLVDTAYSIDPSFGESLAQLVTDDPARTSIVAGFKDRLSVQRLRQELADGNSSPAVSDWAVTSENRWASASWLLLMSLNTNRIGVLRPEVMVAISEQGSQAPLRIAYPSIALLVQNQVRKYASDNNNGPRILRRLFDSTVAAAELAFRLSSREPRLLYEPLTHNEHAENLVVPEGHGDDAVAYVEHWLATHSPEFLRIAEPYFDIDYLLLLRIIQQQAPSCRVEIITGRRLLLTARNHEDLREDLRAEWRRRYSDQSPPDVDITLVGTERRPDSPIHDRWWLGPNAGLRFGSSWNGMGKWRMSEISEIAKDDIGPLAAELQRYLSRSIRTSSDERLVYDCISL